MRKIYSIVLIFLFLFSRLFFLNSEPVFFDSPEYLNRLSNSNFLESLSSGHLPLHSGFILIFWPIFQAGKFLNTNPASLTILFQIILSLFSIVYFYKLIKIISNQKIALLSAIIASLTPLYWIANATVMMETTYISFLIFSLYFWIKYLSAKKAKNIYLFLSVLFFGISFFTHIIVVLWLPLFIYFIYLLNLKRLKKSVFFLIISLIIFSLINAYFIAFPTNSSLKEGVTALYTSKLRERSFFVMNTNGVLAYLRNFIIPLLRNNTNLVAILGFTSLFILLFKNKKYFLLSFLWIAPSAIANQWWDSLFFGRHSLFATFGLAFLVAYVIYRKKKIVFVFIIYLLITSIPAVFLLRSPIPYLAEVGLIKSLPKDSFLIESHFARPQIDGKYKSELLFIDEGIQYHDKELTDKIRNYLKNGKNVFVTAQALSEPYGLYSGPYIHSLSLSYKKDFILKNIITNFTLKEYKIINKNDNIVIYQVESSKPSSYPNIQNMKFNNRRLDYYDPISQLWFLIDKKLEIKI